jgi:putative transposase
MPRKYRFALPGVPQHIIQRGNNRAPCFYTEGDYRHYKEDLEKACNKFGCRVHAYVLMTNHVHLLVTPLTEDSVPSMMQALGRRYVRRFNKIHDRTGTLWEGRYKACLIDSESYLLTCMRYIELNPVRAAMVQHPDQYGWSSYAFNALGQPDPLLHPHPVYEALSGIEAHRRRLYRELFEQVISPATVNDIREALTEELVLGRDEFKDEIERKSKRQTRRGQPGRPAVRETSANYAADQVY